MPGPNLNPQTPEEKYELIAHGLQEVMNGVFGPSYHQNLRSYLQEKEIIKEVLEKGERPLSIYWGD
ncbi:unnamed protein product [Aureobasidium pullulans]|nr:unnamed protein product [Aureobasidium pullulans]